MTYRPLGEVFGWCASARSWRMPAPPKPPAPVLKFSVSRKLHNIPGVGLTPFDDIP